MERYGGCHKVRPVCLVYAYLFAFGYLYCGHGSGVMRVPVYGKERDCAGTCRLVVLAYDVFEVGGLGGAGPCSSGVYVALAGGSLKERIQWVSQLGVENVGVG